MGELQQHEPLGNGLDLGADQRQTLASAPCTILSILVTLRHLEPAAIRLLDVAGRLDRDRAGAPR
jgi:hypothetical protein